MVEDFNSSVLEILNKLKDIKSKSVSDMKSMRRKFLIAIENDKYIIYNEMDIKLLQDLADTLSKSEIVKEPKNKDAIVQQLHKSIKTCYTSANEDEKKVLRDLLNNMIEKYNSVKTKT